MAKSINISKKEVWEAYKAVRANKGSEGVDKQTMADFDSNLSNNLYKIWNRMTSGSYFPQAVRKVDIPKSNGKLRPLGIPTIADRIAQMIVKNRLEPMVEPYFHDDSYGYRPKKSALEAISQARKRCWRDNWVLDMDIRGFFDALDHKILIKAVSRYTQCRWIILYIERWLKAEMELPCGKRLKRDQGTPQGGVISPLLANIFLHLVFDKWMEVNYPHIHFERYADDIAVHCRSKSQLDFIWKRIRARFTQFKLELCEEKTKQVYCKDSNRPGNYPHQSFDFLGYTFRPRSVRDKQGRFFVSFTAAVSRKALKAMRQKLKEHGAFRCYSLSIEELAQAINPMIQGWINYYSKFSKSSMSAIYNHINCKLVKWVMRKYKNLQRRKTRASHWLRRLYKVNPKLFAHWRVWKWLAE